MQDNTYTSKDIKKLEFPESVQKYVGMYLGSSDVKGKLHTIYEIVSNSVDEYNAGFGKQIDVKIEDTQNGELIIVKDRGRGIPFDVRPDGVNTLTFVLTNLHTGGKILGEKNAYVISGGLHGVGASVVLATAKYFEVIVARKKENKVVRQVFEKGYAVTEVEEITPEYFGSKVKEFLIVENYDGTLDIEKIQKENPDKYVIENGTEIKWIPWNKNEKGEGIFSPENIPYAGVKNYLENLAYLNPDLIIKFNYKEAEEKFYHPNGLEEYIEEKILANISQKEVLVDKIRLNCYIDSEKQIFNPSKENIKKQVNPEKNFIITEAIFTLALTGEFKTEKYFVNNIPTSGGKEKQAYYFAFKEELKNFAQRRNISVTKINFNLFEKIFNCVSHIKLVNPILAGQTKDRLENPEVYTYLKNVLSGSGSFLEKFFEQNEELTKKILKVLEDFSKLEKNEEKLLRDFLKEKNAKKNKILLNEKLADCKLQKGDTELYICEGISAMGPIKNARDPNFQAVLPISGKIKNVSEVKNFASILKNNDIANIITALECGVGKDLDIEKLKYGKIILLSDSDDDGYHINSLLLTLFFKLFRPLIEKGKVFVGISPLYEIKHKKNKKQVYYLYTKEEFENFKKRKKMENYIVKRNKGLGEMSAEAMWESTLNPKNRRLIQITADNLEENLKKIALYMSPKKTEERKKIFVEDMLNF